MYDVVTDDDVQVHCFGRNVSTWPLQNKIQNCDAHFSSILFVLFLICCSVVFFVSTWIAAGWWCFILPHLQVCKRGWGASSHLHVVLPGNLLCKANDCSGNTCSPCETSCVMTVLVAAWARSTLMAFVCAMLVSLCASSPDGTCLCHVCFTNL